MRQIVCLSLQALGYRVLSAGSARAALEIAMTHAGPIHVLLTDVVMPEVGGRDLAEQLLAAVTDPGALYERVHRRCRSPPWDRGGDRRVSAKPFTPQSLANKLRELLDS